MSVFMEAFYYPAFKMLRSEEANLQGNALSQGPFYERVVEFLGSVVVQPNLILDNTTSSIATFDGRPWNRSEAIEAVRTLSLKLPHLRHCIVKMFQGARDACPSFMTEFAEDGAIEMATEEERELAFRPPTNDCSEGDLGCFRLFARQRHTKNTLLYNANRQYHENNTAGWEKQCIQHSRIEPASFYTAVAKEARRRLESREAETALEHIALATESRALSHRDERQKRITKEEEEKARLAKIPQQMDVKWPNSKGVTKELLKDQLKLYRQLLGNPDFLHNLSGNKESLKKQYVQAVESWSKKNAQENEELPS
jgi:hypothetical protein